MASEGKLDITILYVEDEKDVREKFEKFLSRIVNNVITAQDGYDGYQKYSLSKPDIIITDIRMPKVTGLEMAKKIREYDLETPIIITTAYNESDFLLEALNNRVDYFIFKPIDCDILTNYVQKLASNVSLKKELERERILLKNLLDFQKNMLILVDNGKLTEANKAFLDFFNCKNKELFLEIFSSVESTFESVNDDSFLTKSDTESWLDRLISKESGQAKVKIKKPDNENTEYVFLVDGAKINTKNENTYVVSFTNITDFEARSQLLEYLSSTDSLTGIMNRQKFNEIYSTELTRLERSGSDMCIILFDVDDFKKVNDTLGHDIGDKVLINLCKIISSRIRKIDYFARWGGEEFTILLPYTQLSEALKLAESIRVAIEHNLSLAINSRDNILTSAITCSFGISAYKPNDTRETLLKRADEALYKAKRNGKNRVEAE